MKIGYLVLASERRIIFTKVDDNADICNAIGCQKFDCGSTLFTEDQLLISGDRLHGMPEHWFEFGPLSLEFSGNAVLVGVSGFGEDILEQPVMTIDEFRSRITFTRGSEFRRSLYKPAGRA